MYSPLIKQDKKIKKHLNLVNLYQKNCEIVIQNIQDVLLKESNWSIQDRRINSELPILLDILTKNKLSLFNEYNELFLAIEEYELRLSKRMQKLGLDFFKEDYNSGDYDEFLKRLKKRSFPFFNSYNYIPNRQDLKKEDVL